MVPRTITMPGHRARRKEANGTQPLRMSDNIDELKKQKLDPILFSIIDADVAMVPIIVQTVDGLKDEDRKTVEKLGGKVKDDLYIINAFSADMSSEAILTLIRSPRITRIFYDAQVQAV